MGRLFFLTGVCMTALMHSAWAQDSVAVRTGAHDDYTRVVFDWSSAAPYTLDQESPGVLMLRFQRGAAPDLSGVKAGGSSSVKSVETVPGDAGLTVRVTIDPASQYRHFLVGDRVVIDVYNKDGQAVAKPAPPQEVAPTPAKEENITAAQPAEMPAKPAEPVDPPDMVATSATDLAPAPIPTGTVLEEAAKRIEQPHVITLSSTEEMGMAAFERNGYLWLVIDRPDMTVPPQIAGPKKTEFSAFEKITVPGGVAYRTKLPGVANLIGEGGGLIWRMVVTPAAKTVEPTMPQREFAPGETIRGGTMTWPMPLVTKTLVIRDPDVGDDIHVAAVDASDQFAGVAREFVDFEQLNSPIGLAVVAKADDLVFERKPDGLMITRPGGLALSRVRDITQRIIEQKTTNPDGGEQAAETDAAPDPLAGRIFDFNRWMMGGTNALRENQHVLLAGMAEKDKPGKVQDLLMLAKMNMANDRGQEASGLLNFAQAEMPDIVESPEFLALRGASRAMAGKFEEAFQDLNTPVLKDYKELDYWRAYTAAGLEDWKQAKEFMPADFNIVAEYPRLLQERMLLRLAEIALRGGDPKIAAQLLTTLQKEKQHLQPWTQASLAYLQGEYHRQNREDVKAEEYWKPLLTSKDDLFRTKASLALTMLQLEKKEIKPEEATDRLEGLRYLWRGDELEAQINAMLGELYLEQKRYLKGFGIMRDAAAMSPDSDVGHEVTQTMADSFKNLFLGDQIDALSPIDAITVYEEFRELTPSGDEGNRMIRRLAERLVDADLLGRAADLLKHQVDYRLAGRDAADTSLRLAAIYLLNGNPEPVLRVLDKATAIYSSLPADAEIGRKLREAAMLRARALSQLKRVDEALTILSAYPPAPDVNRLRADIAWNAGMWADAAIALQDLIVDQAMVPGRPLTQSQADLILNRAVALNLSGDRVAIANMREKYGAQMEKTSRSKLFDVVTRPRAMTMTSERASIAALVSEVDIFREFLETYRASESPSN